MHVGDEVIVTIATTIRANLGANVSALTTDIDRGVVRQLVPGPKRLVS